MARVLAPKGRRACAWALTLCMAVVGLGVVTLVNAPKAAAAGYYFTGEVNTNWRMVNSWGGGAETITEAGSAKFTDLQLNGSQDDYSATAEVNGSIVQRYEGSCSSTVTTNFNGRYGDDEAEAPGALDIAERNDGSVWFAAHHIYAEYPYTTTCGEGGSGQTLTGAGGHNYPFELTTDTHPAADRLVGQMSWTYPNLPGGEPPSDSLTEYTYTVTYDLTRIAAPDDIDFDGIPDDQDNCEFFPNSAQHDSDGNGQGDDCTPVFAEDDIKYVDYLAGTSAPATSVSVLSNDSPTKGLVVDSVSVSDDRWTADSGDGLFFRPGNNNFVGEASAGYGVRFDLDTQGTTRDSADVTLIYRVCTRVDLDVTAPKLESNDAWGGAEGTVKICTDGSDTHSEVTSIRTWRSRSRYFTTVIEAGVGLAVSRMTGKAVKLDLTSDWEGVARVGDARLKASLVGCDKWQFDGRFTLRTRLGQRIFRKLKDLIGETRARELVDMLLIQDYRRCGTHAGYRTGAPQISALGELVLPITTINDPKRSPFGAPPLWVNGVKKGSGPAVTNYEFFCPLVPEVDGGLLLTTCETRKLS